MENTIEMNMPLLSKYCCLENELRTNKFLMVKRLPTFIHVIKIDYLHRWAANIFMFSEKYTESTVNRKERENMLWHFNF